MLCFWKPRQKNCVDKHDDGAVVIAVIVESAAGLQALIVAVSRPPLERYKNAQNLQFSDFSLIQVHSWTECVMVDILYTMNIREK